VTRDYAYNLTTQLIGFGPGPIPLLADLFAYASAAVVVQLLMRWMWGQHNLMRLLEPHKAAEHRVQRLHQRLFGDYPPPPAFAASAHHEAIQHVLWNLSEQAGLDGLPRSNLLSMPKLHSNGIIGL